MNHQKQLVPINFNAIATVIILHICYTAYTTYYCYYHQLVKVLLFLLKIIMYLSKSQIVHILYQDDCIMFDALSIHSMRISGQNMPLNKIYLVVCLATPTFSMAENLSIYLLLPSLFHDGSTTGLLVDCSMNL